MKPQKSILINKAKSFSTVIGISLLSVPILSNITNAQSQLPALQTGLQFQESEEFNVGAITTLLVTTTYSVNSGKCIGQFYVPNSETGSRTYEQQVFGKAAFISHTTLPAPGLRVIIRNVTSGIDKNPYPYTDREYDKSRISEGFKVYFDIEHRGSYLAVKPGNNDFSYEIRRGNTIIESGTFTARIDRRTQSITRNDNLSGNIIRAIDNDMCQTQPPYRFNDFPMQPPYNRNDFPMQRPYRWNDFPIQPPYRWNDFPMRRPYRLNDFPMQRPYNKAK
ncbi:hypothetical protein QUB63_31240 [Microcoleus sp. ARI1-B5]|uniref:hypothetical protein n=1 Tax=unclassified Microcoleus TaxID=2642155 RepID=UPI002FD1BD80